MLSAVDEVQAEHGEFPAGPTKVRVRADADEVAAEGDDDVRKSAGAR